MKLPVLSDFDFQGKRVLVRVDLDVPLRQSQGKLIVEDDSRISECLPTINYLLEHGASLVLMGHLGRPEGKVVEELRMAPVAEKLKELLNVQCTISSGSEKQALLIYNVQLGKFSVYKISENITILENLRFDPREESNDEGFAKELAGLGDFYVNESFATSHRAHASIVGIPKFLPHCAGLHFASEVDNLSKVLENPERPLVFVIGGAKPETKMAYVESFAAIADAVLIGGTLAREKDKIKEKPILDFADLSKDGLDISENSIVNFTDFIEGAGTVVWNGPMGKYEIPEGAEGTRRIGEAVTKIRGFKVVGGGDTIAALKKFELIDKMDYVSTAGGAMLEFLAKGILPGIEALIKK